MRSTLTANNFANIEYFETPNSVKEASGPAASFNSSFSAGEGRFQKLLSREWSGFCGFLFRFSKQFCQLLFSVWLSDPEYQPDIVQNGG